MNIDIQQYRSTIGVYYSVIINKYKTSVYQSDNKQKFNIKVVLLCLALFFSKFDFANQKFTNLSYRNSFMRFDVFIFKQGPLINQLCIFGLVSIGAQVDSVSINCNIF